MVNMGVMNVASSLFGGCRCATARGRQNYFGVARGHRTSSRPHRAALGVFLGRSLLGILGAFPMPLIGG